MKIITPKIALMHGIVFFGTQILSAREPLPIVPQTSAGIGPRIQFQAPQYDFGKIKSGEPVKHSFVFTNTGDSLLILTNVQPQCGCTTAGEWTRQVEPGKCGTIAVQFNSGNFNGQVLKTIAVTSNDKTQPSVRLQLQGNVWKPIELKPSFLVLTIPPDTEGNVTNRVHILNNTAEPLWFSQPESSNKAFTADLKTNIVDKDYEVIVCALPPFQPGLKGQITLKTSWTNTPNISFTVWANIQPSSKSVSLGSNH